MLLRLRIVEGPQAGNDFSLAGPGEFSIGRGKDADVRLVGDPYVSRIHCIIEVTSSGCLLRDQGSQNPVQVNSLICAEEELHDGDEIQVGFTRLRVGIGPGEPAMEGGAVRSREDPPGKAYAHASKPSDPVCYRCGKPIESKLSAGSPIAPPDREDVFCCGECLPEREEGLPEFGPFPILTRLGEGAMAEVFLAHEVESGRLVALKRLWLDVDQLTERFVRACQYLEKVRHPNIMRVYGHGNQGDIPYMLMEYAPLGDLDEFVLHTSGPLSPELALGIMLGVLEGLEQMHQDGRIHRDIKPGNILLRRPGGTEEDFGSLEDFDVLVPKIADFELTKHFGSASGLTQLGMAKGTPIYAPRELLHGTRPLTPATDLYSVGVTLYYLLSGKYPFSYPTPLEGRDYFENGPAHYKDIADAFEACIMERGCPSPEVIVFREEPVPLEKRSAGRLPTGLCEAVDWAIRPRSEDRYQNARDFIRALQTSGVSVPDRRLKRKA